MTYELAVALIRSELPPLSCPVHGLYEPHFERHDGPQAWVINFRPCCWRAAFELCLAIRGTYGRLPKSIPSKIPAVRLKLRTREGTPVDTTSPKTARLLETLAEAMTGYRCSTLDHDPQAALTVEHDADGDTAICVDGACCALYERALKYAIWRFLCDNRESPT